MCQHFALGSNKVTILKNGREMQQSIIITFEYTTVGKSNTNSCVDHYMSSSCASNRERINEGDINSKY